jgi:LPPG:FO 2-phospho-L-lactate transferase
MSAIKKILCLCGGVGGAKLAYGFSQLLQPGQLTIVVNTGDDFHHLGYHISPDIDTVIYNLAQINNEQLGWGIQNESWHFMARLRQEKPEHSWFQLGDQDLMTHQYRTALLEQGLSLTQATRSLCDKYGVAHSVIPMSNDPVQTTVHTRSGELPFQHYFVREKCQPAVRGFSFHGIEQASPSAEFIQTLQNPNLEAVIICPSNPFLSIDPILALPGIRSLLTQVPVPVIAISPLIGGKAVKGPTAKIMQELNIPCSSAAIASHYAGLVSHLLVDPADQHELAQIRSTGIQCLVHPTLMRRREDKIELARYLLRQMGSAPFQTLKS